MITPRFLAACFLLALCGPVFSAEPVTLNVWPGKAPGETADIGPEAYQPERPGERKVARLGNVSTPTIAVYSPPAEKHTGAAVLICPGGGYRILAMDLEGTEVAEWLNSIGVTGIVLKYRVPQREGQPRGYAQLQDAQRAMSLVRSRAKEWNLDPQRIGILGFSAGGHVAATTCLYFKERAYPPIDDHDEVSSRPDFGVLIYPGYLTADDGTLRSELEPTAETPPMFFAHAADDRVKPDNSIALFQALRKANVPAELHIYATGGHGFGLRKSDQPCSTWPQRCEEWMRHSDWLTAKK